MGNIQEKLEESRKDTITKINKIIEEYYAKYQKAGEEKELTINHIEQFLLDSKSKVDKVFKEASTDIIREIESDLVKKKTSARIVRKP